MLVLTRGPGQDVYIGENITVRTVKYGFNLCTFVEFNNVKYTLREGKNHAFKIGDIKISIWRVSKYKIRIGIDAPKCIPIERDDIKSKKF
jgi:sRNA-binding carbon storage regulator CsrA